MRKAILAAGLAVACGGGGPGGNNNQGGPIISSFTANPATVTAGQSVQLTAVFAGGTGSIDQGVSAVQSGVAVTVTPAATTTYTLTVTGSGNASVTATAVANVSATALCIGKTLLTGLGKTHMLTGFADGDGDPTETAATWDADYRYLAGGLSDGASVCTSTCGGCSSGGNSCGTGCGWWGCFQEANATPGLYVTRNSDASQSRGQIQWFTYYEILQSSGTADASQQEVQSLSNATFAGRVLSDLQFLFKTIGNRTVFVHVEPDFWGYAQHYYPDPTQLPVPLSGFSDCAGQPNTLVGFVRCVIGMARKYSPNAKIGFHASAFATGIDVGLNTNPALDVAGEAKKITDYFKALGADASDFVAVDASDRDAGYYDTVLHNQHDWDASNTTLPNFHQHLTWVKALAENLSLPVFYWQVPIGNSAQNNTPNHYKDNRVDYFYAHPDELAAAHVAGVLFGAGQGDQTLATTDGGNLVDKQKAYVTSGGEALCQ